jgi:hypothetical protein
MSSTDIDHDHICDSCSLWCILVGVMRTYAMHVRMFVNVDERISVEFGATLQGGIYPLWVCMHAGAQNAVNVCVESWQRLSAGIVPTFCTLHEGNAIG